MNERNVAGQVRIHDLYRRQGQKAPLEAGPEPHLAILWRRGECCGKRMLRVFLNPDGWHVFVEPFRERPEELIERAVKQRAVPDRETGQELLGRRRKIDRHEPISLAMDIETWAKATFEVGCDHSLSWHGIEELQADAREFRETHRLVTRNK